VVTKQQYIDSIFNENQKRKYCTVPYKDLNIRNECICDCGNEKFYRLVDDYIVCSKCFAGYGVNIDQCYLQARK